MLSISERTPLTNHRSPDIEVLRCKADCRHSSKALLVALAAENGGLSYLSPGKVLPEIPQITLESAQILPKFHHHWKSFLSTAV